MAIPSTRTLDHIVHLTPPGTVDQAAQQFRELGFNVIAGGTHAGGLTANSLVVLPDGVYLELIAFTHPASDYPRDAHPWSHKLPGWIDYAFLGSAAVSVSRVINARAAREGSGVRYAPEVSGGRTRAGDGRVLKWVISAVEDGEGEGDDGEGGETGPRGCAPFFCGDITPREWRVPTDAPSNMIHPSGAQGIAYVRLLAAPDALARLAAQLTSVVGEPPEPNNANAPAKSQPEHTATYTWILEVPPGNGTPHPHPQNPRLVLSGPQNEEEREHVAAKGPGVFEVGFSVGPDGVERVASTPYGKIVWLRSP